MPGGAWHLLCVTLIQRARIAFRPAASGRRFFKEPEVIGILARRCVLAAVALLLATGSALALP